MNKDQKVTSKSLAYTLLTILLGYALLKVPVIGFIVECLVIWIVFLFLYEAFDYVIYNRETEKEIEKLNKKPTKKKGK